MSTCPFMSRPIEKTIREEMLGISMGTTTRYYTEFVKVECMKEDCEAWTPHVPVDEFDTVVGGKCRLIP